MIAAIERLPAKQQRALAVALFVVAAIVALSVLLLPVVWLHIHYNDAIATLTDRLDTYRRVAAQAPEYRKALDAMREKDARRFFLKNTAANLAGAELQELVRAAIEGNGGRITTSQNQAPKDEGRYRQIGLNVQFFASTPNLQKILYALETQQPYLVIENLQLRPLNAFRGFRPAAGAGARGQRADRCRRLRFHRAGEDRAMDTYAFTAENAQHKARRRRVGNPASSNAGMGVFGSNPKGTGDLGRHSLLLQLRLASVWQRAAALAPGRDRPCDRALERRD